MKLLKFSNGNKKLDKDIATFTLPAGKTCPFAQSCRTVVAEKDGKSKLYDLQTGTEQYRCYAASLEVLYPQLRNMVNHNFDLLKKCNNLEDMIKLIDTSLPDFDKIRLHVGGDFFSLDYFKAWMYVAALNPDKHFYAYTKSLTYWVECLDIIPSNMVLTASYGSSNDELIDRYNLKNVKIFKTEEDALKDGRNIDKDDSIAMNPDIKKFGLLLHGVQPKKQ